MSIFLIIGIIFLLYIRTLNFNYIIDDNVKRDGYMYEVPLTLPDPNFFMTKPSAWYRLFMIGMHCVNTWVIYMLWGWCPALLFGIHPQAVWGVAWVTGNYYATTAYFCLISYYVLHAFPNIWGAMVAMPIFAAALNSTICCVSFPFLFVLLGNWWGCSLLIPLAIYLRGNRFIAGINIRDSFKANKPLDFKLTYKRIFLMVKVMGLYVMGCIFPDKLCLFTPYAHNINDSQKVYDYWQSRNGYFWAALLLCATVFVGGLFVSPVGTLWFFIVLALHSQWRLTGQFYAQRYLYLALPGFCVVAGLLLQSHTILVAIVATALFLRSYLFIGSFKNNETLHLNDFHTFPNFQGHYNTLAQYYLNYPYPKDVPMPAWRVNQIGYLLFKAEALEPDSWSIKMNVACFFALVNQWQTCQQKTQESLNLVKPLGGLPHPVQILTKQLKNIDEIFRLQRENVELNIIQVLEQNIKATIDLIEHQKDPDLLPISTELKNLIPLLSQKAEKRSINLLNSIGHKLNDLKNLVPEQHKIAVDADFLLISKNLDALIEKKQKDMAGIVSAQNKQAAANISPAQLTNASVEAGK